MKYQYVLIQGDDDYYRAMTQHTVERGEAISLYSLFDCKSELVCRYLTKIYNHLPMPALKKMLLPFMFNRSLPKDKPVCFVFMGWYANPVKDLLGAHLRRKYPGCKLVCRFEDIIEKMPYHNFYEYKEHFDMLLTLDEMESRKYNIPYYPSWYDECDVPDGEDIEESDVLFVGRAKDRMPEIIAAYEKLAGAGLNCKFYLVDVPKDQQTYADQIVYCEYIPYMKVLQYVKKTKCMLEILQKKAESETLRVFEAIHYNKKLITSNQNILTRDFYDPQKILYYENIDQLDPKFVHDETTVTYADEYREKSKPYNMLNFIDNYLSEM